MISAAPPLPIEKIYCPLVVVSPVIAPTIGNGDADNCRAQLALLSGQTARFHTGCAIIANGERLINLDTTSVAFRLLTAEEIERYVSRERPFDCAGGFKVEALGITLFESIESRDPTALIGLPLIWLASALRSVGYVLP